MAGAVAAVGTVAACVVLAGGLAAVGAAAAAGQRLAAAADSSALAAADAASGAVSGVPCDRAGEIATAHGVELEACDLDELVATVTVSTRFGPLRARASARAGPPP